MSVVCRNIWTALLALVCGMFGTINAATVDYNGSAESGDISQGGNWTGGTLPAPSDTAVFPNGFLSPASGLTLGAALTLGSFRWDDADRVLDLGGKTLTLNDQSGITQISIGESAKLTIKNGTIDVTSRVQSFLPSGDYGTLILTNMNLYVKSPHWRFTNSFGKGFTTMIMKGARVVCSELPPGDQRLPMIGKSDCKFVVDGGFFSAISKPSGDRRLAFNQEWENGIVKIINGGVVDFPTPPGNTATVRFNGNPSRVLIDGGAMYSTNNLTWNTDNYGLRFANYSRSNPGSFAVTNSILKGTRFNHYGNGGVATFHNSEVDFYFNNHSYAGYFFGAANGHNSAVVSGTTSFKAKTLTWNPSSAGNDTFTVAGGTFDAQVAMSGTNGVFTMTEGVGMGAIVMSGGSNRVDVTGGKWTHATENKIEGVSNLFYIAGNASVTGTHTVVSGAYSWLVQDGASAHGGVQLHGSNTRAHLKNGARRFAQHRMHGLQFKDGISNAVFIIEDSTYENKGLFAGSYTGSGYTYTDVGRVYVNCPGSAIEFRGSSPKLIESEATLYEGAGVYMSMVLGSFTQGTDSSGPLLGTEPLSDPVALRYVLPPDGYAEAPLYGTVTRNGGRPIALCGNARIEVDDSAFVREREKRIRRIPLIKDEANFTDASGFLMLDIDALNRNNAANLPEDAKLEYIPEDKTVYLKFAYRGFMMIVR